MAFASGIAAGVAPLGQRVRGVFRLPPLSLWTPLSPQRERGCSPLSVERSLGIPRPVNYGVDLEPLLPLLWEDAASRTRE